MLKVGLTGGIGCGKSSAVAAFRRLGVPVVDADRIAREVVQPGEPVLLDVVRAFGADALLADGSLDRAWMRAKVFAEPAARARLEGLLHPVIRARIAERIQAVAESGAPYVVVDVPLLVEQGYQGLFDRIVVVDCLPEQQLQRVRMRDGSDESQIANIMQVQAGRAERLRWASDILDNTGEPSVLATQVDHFHSKMLTIVYR